VRRGVGGVGERGGVGGVGENEGVRGVGESGVLGVGERVVVRVLYVYWYQYSHALFCKFSPLLHSNQDTSCSCMAAGATATAPTAAATMIIHVTHSISKILSLPWLVLVP
jgi:hypothetical protein